MSPPGRISSAIPANPMSTPTIDSGLSRRPFAAKSKVAIQSGKVATMSAATPVSIRCWATATSALPPTSRNEPTIAAEIQWRSVGPLPRPEDREQDRPGDEEPERGHQERRDRLDRDLHPEVRRTPDDVDRAERGPDRCGRGP